MLLVSVASGRAERLVGGEMTMAKGQKRSTREPRKPKQAKAKPPISKGETRPHSFLQSVDRALGQSPAGPAGQRR
jgi:hypothetical protein